MMWSLESLFGIVLMRLIMDVDLNLMNNHLGKYVGEGLR